jgi:peptidoglycan/LPS O-acetylase OafA/YrhL
LGVVAPQAYTHGRYLAEFLQKNRTKERVMSTEESGRRLVGLDALRGVAVLLVLLFHFSTRFDEVYGYAEGPPFDVPWGYVGVSLFFMISGFVIYMTLDGIKRPADFLVSRFSRLYPTYWCAVLITALCVTVWPVQPGPEPNSALVVALNLMMFHGLFGVPSVDGVYWTLEVELLFYLLMFFAWASGLVRRPILLVSLWAGLSLLSGVLPGAAGITVPYVIQKFLILQYIPEFCMGIIIFLMIRSRRTPGDAQRPGAAVAGCGSLALGGVLLLCLAAMWAHGGAVRVMWAAVFAPLMGVAATGRCAAWLQLRPLVWLGAISYPLYLVHQDLGHLVIAHALAAHVPALLAVAAAMVVALFLALGLHRVIELLAMQLIRNAYIRRLPGGRLVHAAPGATGRWLLGILVTMAMLLAANRWALAQ